MRDYAPRRLSADLVTNGRQPPACTAKGAKAQIKMINPGADGMTRGR